jgi:hypothetical protein
MIIRFNPRWLLVPALLFSLQFCRAQVPLPGTISFDLGDPNVDPETQLWDLSGLYQLDVPVDHDGLEEELRLSFVLLQSGSGKLSSITNDNFQEMDLGDNSVFAVTPRISGKVTGSHGNARVHFTIHLRGSGTLAGKNVNSFSAMLTVDAETDSTTGELLGTKISKFSARFPDLKTIHGKVVDFFVPMPQGSNATWNLSLHLAGLRRLTGTGVITTPSRALGLNLSGKFKSRSESAEIFARGANTVADTTSGKGIKARIELPNTFDSMIFHGKVLGQRFAFGFPPAD